MSAGSIVYADVKFNNKPTQGAGGQAYDSVSHEPTYSDVKILKPHPSKNPQEPTSTEQTYAEVKILKPQRSHSSNEPNKSNGGSKANSCDFQQLRIALVALFLLLAVGVSVIVVVVLRTTQTTKDLKSTSFSSSSLTTPTTKDSKSTSFSSSSLTTPTTKDSKSTSFSSSCPNEWEHHGRKCYYLSNDALNWNQSQNDCISKGGHLAIIKSAEEQIFLHGITKNKIEGDEKFWIGLTDKDDEGTWMWVDNTIMNNSFWFSNSANGEEPQEPDNWTGESNTYPGGEDCVRLGEKDDLYKFKCWFDSFCDTAQKRICETKAT